MRRHYLHSLLMPQCQKHNTYPQSFSNTPQSSPNFSGAIFDTAIHVCVCLVVLARAYCVQGFMAWPSKFQSREACSLRASMCAVPKAAIIISNIALKMKLYLGVLGNNFYFLRFRILRNSKNYDFCYGSKFPNV